MVDVCRPTLFHALHHLSRFRISHKEHIGLVYVVDSLGIHAQNDHPFLERTATVHVSLVHVQISASHITSCGEVPDLSPGANGKGQVVVHAVDGRPQVFRLCPTPSRVARCSVNVKSSHALEAVRGKEHGLAVGSHKWREFIAPGVDSVAKALQLAPMAILPKTALIQVVASFSPAGFHTGNQPILPREKGDFSLRRNLFVQQKRLSHSPSALPFLRQFEFAGPSIVVEHNQLFPEGI